MNLTFLVLGKRNPRGVLEFGVSTIGVTGTDEAGVGGKLSSADSEADVSTAELLLLYRLRLTKKNIPQYISKTKPSFYKFIRSFNKFKKKILFIKLYLTDLLEGVP